MPANAEEGTLLNAARVEALVGSVVEGGADGGPAGAASWVQVISAFDVPKILYDPIRKSFYRAPQPTSLLGTAEVWTISVPASAMGCLPAHSTSEMLRHESLGIFSAPALCTCHMSASLRARWLLLTFVHHPCLLSACRLLSAAR